MPEFGSGPSEVGIKGEALELFKAITESQKIMTRLTYILTILTAILSVLTVVNILILLG